MNGSTNGSVNGFAHISRSRHVASLFLLGKRFKPIARKTTGHNRPRQSGLYVSYRRLVRAARLMGCEPLDLLLAPRPLTKMRKPPRVRKPTS